VVGKRVVVNKTANGKESGFSGFSIAGEQLRLGERKRGGKKRKELKCDQARRQGQTPTSSI
jgi:hypothetical protein